MYKQFIENILGTIMTNCSCSNSYTFSNCECNKNYHNGVEIHTYSYPYSYTHNPYMHAGNLHNQYFTVNNAYDVWTRKQIEDRFILVKNTDEVKGGEYRSHCGCYLCR